MNNNMENYVSQFEQMSEFALRTKPDLIAGIYERLLNLNIPPEAAKEFAIVVFNSCFDSVYIDISEQEEDE